MFGVILLIIATFIAVLAMGIKLTSQTDEVHRLKTELENKISSSENAHIDSNDILKVIQEEGYFPTKDSDGEISFMIKGTRLVVGECANGFVYTRVYYGFDRKSIQTGLHAANAANMTYVAVKVIVAEESESVIFSVESYCLNIEVYRDFFRRSLSILADTIEKFRAEIQIYDDCQTSNVALSEEQNNRFGEPKVLS